MNPYAAFCKCSYMWQFILLTRLEARRLMRSPGSIAVHIVVAVVVGLLFACLSHMQPNLQALHRFLGLFLRLPFLGYSPLSCGQLATRSCSFSSRTCLWILFNSALLLQQIFRRCNCAPYYSSSSVRGVLVLTYWMVASLRLGLCQFRCLS